MSKSLPASYVCYVCVWVSETDHQPQGVGEGGVGSGQYGFSLFGRVDLSTCPGETEYKTSRHEKNLSHMDSLGIPFTLFFLSRCLFWTGGESISYATHFSSSQIIKRKNLGV